MSGADKRNIPAYFVGRLGHLGSSGIDWPRMKFNGIALTDGANFEALVRHA